MKNLIVIFSIIMFVTGCTKTNVNNSSITNSEKPDIPIQEEVNKNLPSKNNIEVSEITIKAIGDVLLHKPVYEAARTKNGFDFNPMFQNVKNELQDSDITTANQESMIGGEKIGLSSYPNFNSPQEIGIALKQSGVDIVTLANNHTLDRGEKSIINAIEYWDKIGMKYTGSFKSFEDSQEIRTITKKGVTVSFLAYTYGTNGIPVPKGKEYLVNIIDDEKMKKEIEKAKKISDVVSVSLHFGNEYERMPNEFQKSIVEKLSDYGADIIFGSHPHVLQPVEWVEGREGNKTFVIYSLGNFLSNQSGDYKDIGGIVGVKIRKVKNGSSSKIEVIEPSLHLTYVSKSNKYKINFLKQINESKFDELKKHMNKFTPELTVN